MQNGHWWVYELVRQVATSEVERELGYPSIANGFKSDPQLADSRELQAMREALEWLKQYSPDAHSRVTAFMRGRDDGSLELMQAMVMLGQKIDEVLG